MPIRVPVLGAGTVLGRRDAVAPAPGEVCLHAFDLATDAPTLVECASLLSREELDRAGRFAFPRLRERFVAAHGLVRHVLARYLGVEARAIAFVEAPEGKPAIEGARGLSFNLSHSHDRALLAVGDGRELGVDVEQERDDVEMLGIAESYFYRSELAAIRSAPPGRQREAFFRYWVAKESVLKGEGCGLGFPLDRFEVVFAPEGASASIVSLDAARMRGDWTIRMLSLGDGWPAAIAARGVDWRLRACGAAD